MNRKVRIEAYTRREFREALRAGSFRAAIIATGSIEQHLEHLALEQDIASSTHVAERAAEALYPSVAVVVPLSIGIAEHHMYFPGTMSAKPGSWLAVLFDAVESLVRHGITRVLILNGHGGNVKPVRGRDRPVEAPSHIGPRHAHTRAMRRRASIRIATTPGPWYSVTSLGSTCGSTATGT